MIRDYQEFAVNSVFDYFGKASGNPVIAMPTGTGKSFVIAETIRRAMQWYPDTRVMMLTHVKELIGQDHDKLMTVWPGAPAGIFSAGLGLKQAHHPIVFGGIGSVARKDMEAFGHRDLLFVDEAHMISFKKASQYQQTIAAMREINPALKVIGLTATKYRMGNGLITEPGGIFTDVCCDMTTMESFNWFIDQGYLSMLYPKKTTFEYDTSGVHTRGGEFIEGELERAVNREELTYQALEEAVMVAADRKRWLVFCAGVEHTEATVRVLDALGVSATCVHSKMTTAERDRNLALHRNGSVRAMVNNGVLTTGYDDPEIDCIVVLRPTRSTPLWVQLLGRGTRPLYAPGFDLWTQQGRFDAMRAGGKNGCLVLDFAANSRILGPINDPLIPKAKGKGGGGGAPIKICMACEYYNHSSARFCEHCGTEFPRFLAISVSASSDELIRREKPKEPPAPPVVTLFPIDRVTFAMHDKPGKPTSLKVTYHCGLRMFNEWVCFEHGGFVAKRARDWWRKRSDTPPPDTVAEAIPMLETLKVPKIAHVWDKEKGLPEIRGFTYDD